MLPRRGEAGRPLPIPIGRRERELPDALEESLLLDEVVTALAHPRASDRLRKIREEA